MLWCMLDCCSYSGLSNTPVGGRTILYVHSPMLDARYTGLFTSYQPCILSLLAARFIIICHPTLMKSLGWPLTCYVSQASFEFTIFLPLPHEQRDNHAWLPIARILALALLFLSRVSFSHREAINRLHEAVPGVRGSWKKKVGVGCGPA